MEALICTQCGAPLNGSGKCDYCGTLYTGVPQKPKIVEVKHKRAGMRQVTNCSILNTRGKVIFQEAVCGVQFPYVLCQGRKGDNVSFKEYILETDSYNLVRAAENEIKKHGSVMISMCEKNAIVKLEIWNARHIREDNPLFIAVEW